MKKLSLLIVVAMFAASGLLYSRLPAMLPVHWNVRGDVDGYMPKNLAVFMTPGIALLIFGLFQILPQFDPKKEKYILFRHEYEIIQTSMIAFFAYMEFLTYYLSLHPTVNIRPLLFIGLGGLFILLGNFLSKIRQNYFVGVKTPWALANEDNWNKTHRFASWCFVLAGIATLAESFFLWYAPVIIFGGIMLAALLPYIYSFLLFKKQADKMKYVILGITVLIAVVAGIRLFSGDEDFWMCQNGQWVAHGHPTAAIPVTTCK